MVLHLGEAQQGKIDPWENDGGELFPEALATEHFGGLDHQEQEDEDVDGRDEEIEIPDFLFAT